MYVFKMDLLLLNHVVRICKIKVLYTLFLANAELHLLSTYLQDQQHKSSKAV